MSELLRMTLFGSPSLLLGDQPVTGFVHNKAKALLFYLAVTGQTHSRDALATLLWSELTDAQAKNNLRTVLPEVRRLLGDHVVIERQTVAFQRASPYWLDVEVLRRALTPGRTLGDLATRQAAVELYQGDFLGGFYVNDAPGFDAWMLEQREQLHNLVIEALVALVSEHVQGNNTVAALAANRRLLVLEPWSEPVHRQQMLLLAQTGERSAALAQYEACQRILAAEFGLAPLAETTALYEQIRTGEIGRPGDRETGFDVSSAERGQGDRGQGGKLGGSKPGVSRQTVQVPRQAEQSDSGQVTPVVGHNLPPRTKLYGRQPELARLHKWVVEDGCHLVGLFGIGGQGKTTLAATLVRDLAEPTSPLGAAVKFQRILWQSLLNAPPLAEVMQEWFYVLSDQAVTTLPTSLDQQFSQLLDYLRRQRCLLVLDNLESILQGDERGGYYRPGYEVYGQLLRRLVAGEHHSCLLLTSRERPHDLTHLEEDTATVRFLSLAGLSIDAGQAELQARGVVGAPADLAALVQHYSGNPLALKLVAETIQNIFAGNITAFLQVETLVFDDIRDVLDQQFARLAPLEHELMVWLAIVREPIPFDALRALLAQSPAARLMLEAMRSLQRRSLVENYADGFGLQNVVLEYTTGWLVDGICAELVNGEGETGRQGDTRQGDNADEALLVPLSPCLPVSLSPFVSESLLNRYALVLAQVKEYVRASQTRLLLQAVADRLVTHFGSTGAEQQLQQQLALLRTRARLRTAPSTRGYAAANLLHLLLQLGVDLSGYDFSQLSLRQLYLRGVSLPQTNFAQAAIIDTVFTEPFGLVRTVAFSPDGQYVAAGTGEGAIYLWRTDDQQLVQVLQLHDQFITELAFGLRATAGGRSELVLASASDDKRIGVWSLAERAPERWHVPLAHEQQGALRAVTISPDGEHVTGVDGDGHVFVWAVNVHTVAQLVHHFTTQPTRLRLVAFSTDGQTVVVGHREGTVQFWQVASGEAGLVLTATTGSLGALALSPDGQTLVTGDNDGQLCLWTLPAGQRQQVLETKAGLIDALAFSPDGTTLASTHGDRALRVWRIDSHGRAQLRHTLIGHTHSIWSVAFGPSPKTPPALNLAGRRAAARQLLVTGSNDQTVRVWDAESGQALYTLAGQPRALTSLAIAQPPQTHQSAAQGGAQLAAEWVLAAVGYDQLVHLWQGRGVQPHGTPRHLRGQSGPLYAVAMSPDGRFVASAGRDQTIDLWDVGNGKLRQTFHGHVGSIYCLAFQPGGGLLASGGMDGAVRLWSLPSVDPVAGRAIGAALSSQPLAVLQATPRYIYQVAFSPDGRLLASVVSMDRSLHLWDVTDPQHPQPVITQETLQKVGEQALYSLAFSPDGTKLASGGNELIQLCDIHNSGSPLSLQQHTSWIVSLAFSPDGTTLASASADGVICLWAVADGTLRASLLGHSEQIYSIVFSPDGAAVLSCSADGTIKFWDSQTGECVNTLRVEGPYAGMNITGVTGITEAQKASLKVLGAIEKV